MHSVVVDCDEFLFVKKSKHMNKAYRLESEHLRLKEENEALVGELLKYISQAPPSENDVAFFRLYTEAHGNKDARMLKALALLLGDEVEAQRRRAATLAGQLKQLQKDAEQISFSATELQAIYEQ